MILKRKLFSKKNKSKEEKSKSKGNLGKGIAVGSVAAGQVAGTKMALENGILDDMMGEEVSDACRKALRIKKKPSSAEDKKLFKKLSEVLEKKGIKKGGASIVGPAYDNTKDVIVGLDSGKGADVLSHELGHRHYFKEKSGVVGKTAHKIYGAGGSLVHGYITPVVSGVAAGTAAGKSKARKEARGEKESFIGKHGAWAGPAIAAAPMLISEAAASRHGIKTLKNLGASKKYLKEAKKGLGEAFTSYAGQAGMGIGIGVATKERAYRKEKKKLEKEKKKD